MGIQGGSPIDGRAGLGLSAAAYFLLTGVIFATWASRVPAIKGGLNLGEGQFAIALLGLEAGAVLGLQLGGLLVPRVGSRRALTASLVAFACALSGLAFAPGLPLLAASLFAFAALNSVVDVAMNTQGLAFSDSARPVLQAARQHSLGGSSAREAALPARRRPRPPPGVDPRLSRLLRRSRTRGGPGEPVQPALLVLATAFGARAVRLAG